MPMYSPPATTLPIGAVVMSPIAPVGGFWLDIGGPATITTLSRVTYSALWAAVGETYGDGGNGSTTFNIGPMDGGVGGFPSSSKFWIRYL